MQLMKESYTVYIGVVASFFSWRQIVLLVLWYENEASTDRQEIVPRSICLFGGW